MIEASFVCYDGTYWQGWNTGRSLRRQAVQQVQYHHPSKNLWSIEECIAAYQHTNQVDGNVVFIDGSWYHKGTRNGRQE